LIGLLGEAAMVAGDINVAIPALLVVHAAAVNLDEAHAALDQAAGHQALPGEVGGFFCCPVRKGFWTDSGSLFKSSASGAAICMR